jgi:uncharacterized protein (TIGR01777 family)
MHIAITGGSGLVGRHLVPLLIQAGHRVTVLSRTAGAGRAVWIPWPDPANAEVLRGVDAVVHLAGATVAQRWTARTRRDILDSRVLGTRAVVDAMRQLGAEGPRILVSASATGRYRQGTGPQGEEAPPADDFLARVVEAWEHEVRQADALPGVRTVMLRTGLVWAADGGVIARLRPLFALGLGSPLGRGRQIQPWIHIDDLCSLYATALTDSRWHGPVNAVAPEPLTNAAFTRLFASALGRPAFLPPVPSFVLSLALGEFSSALLASHNVAPERALGWGFQFAYPKAEDGLKALLRNAERG